MLSLSSLKVKSTTKCRQISSSRRKLFSIVIAISIITVQSLENGEKFGMNEIFDMSDYHFITICIFQIIHVEDVQFRFYAVKSN